MVHRVTTNMLFVVVVAVQNQAVGGIIVIVMVCLK